MPHHSDRKDAASPPAKRRPAHWLLVVGFVLVVLGLVAVVQHLTGGGIRSHAL